MSLPSFPEHTVAVQYATEHRCGVCIRGPGLTDAVSGKTTRRLMRETSQRMRDQIDEVGRGQKGLEERMQQRVEPHDSAW